MEILASLQEIKERDNTISEKEKRIYDLKKKNQELEKFKFVLDHKIKELKKQIEPKEEEIADMKEQVKVRSDEFSSVRIHKQSTRVSYRATNCEEDGWRYLTRVISRLCPLCWLEMWLCRRKEKLSRGC
jgi:cilia- and flagella-associated protein 57